MDFHIEIEHLIEIEGVDSGNGHAERIADKVADVVVFEDGGAFGEHRTFFGLFDVVLKSHQSVFAGLVQQVVHHFQRIDVSLPGVLGAAEDTSDAANNLLEDVQRVGDENGADGGSADGDKFCGLNEHPEVAVLHEVAGDDATEDDDNSNNCKHELARMNQVFDWDAAFAAGGADCGA